MKKRVCPRCGNEIQKGESFCRNCGNVMPKEKDHTYIYVGVAMFVVIFIVIIGLGILGSEYDETKNIIVDDLSEIVQDEDRAEDYLDTTIHTSGYLFRKEDELDIDMDYAISSSAKSFKKKNYVLIDSDELKNVGSLSKVSMDGSLEKKSGKIVFNVDRVTVDKKLSKEEGKKELEKKLGLNEEKKVVVKEEPSDTVKDGSTVSVDDILSDPEKYAGKRLKIHGMLPQSVLETSDGRLIATVDNMTLDKHIEIRGASPDFGGCEAMVVGTVFLENGTPVINAYSFEALGNTLSADTSDAYYPITDGYTGYTDTYEANYDMVIRNDYSTSAAKVDILKKGQLVKIRDIKSTGQDIWGLIEHGKWVCIEDWNKGMTYLTKVN
ncbi:zinc ribbon domain-containing protein [Holdemanella biformis]|uniref:zinc ribbon domain-containing protein n=1 Tax=Holdemanella biformis TaxID=1735 RepID=UPI001C260182|nr:zinc ribbon domain-containing protein [Holdemanella biformis]MBU9896245.1 zinc ribbon domain-containing protein [Holdemanella biformis]MBV3417389.1 zinc ribbon domain-containing protein [Holdemanella biformis]